MFNELDVNVNDYPLSREDVGQVESAEQVIHFFAALGYDVDQAVPLDHAALGLDSSELRHQIHHVRLVATDPVEQEIRVYLFEVRSVTVALTHAIARRFRERPESALLVLTKDYESLDFVLVERELTKSQSLGRPIKQIIRPRTVTVNRRNPDPVNLRVLKRFTFTEEDGIFQWEKLRSAFTLAQWSEQYFNNRALFSDYYLKERLTDEKLSPAWQEDVRPAGREAHRLLADARRQYSGQPESTIRRGLYEPLFERLGFRWETVKAGDSAAEAPDYQLYDGEGEEPVALALTYAWNRNLDEVDTVRDADTPDEIPGALVVSVLESGGAPWVIVTNGKLWRLYSATASNKATNYYEVDLEEALAATDQIKALKYWWLFFRREAFTGFLEEVQQQSADYARALGERLKERVFEEIFPHFAAGFVQQMRQRDGQHLSDEALDQVFQGTMTFLYRLMFVLYAESLALLPVNEARGYGGISLYKLKREIEEQGGSILDEAPARLKKAYATTSTALYERLQRLFRAIGEGDEAFNLPAYNGGLFSRQTENGKFLAAEAIPDRHLALGLDRLCRDVDDKTQALAMIDFKSLGVRHLGSVYEGLLEFKLRLAGEKLAVVREKGREVYLPFKKAQNKRVLATLAKGDVYLANDKRERKATGSYYTPDYIVKYIVAHTVGPVLERKFEELAPRLREAQKRYRQHKKLVEARGNDQPPELFWRNADMQQLADDCLNVRTLDPAMGSGHFLVEVVDFVSNRLITFLNAWSENPVWAMLERTRGDILDEMERQRVSIDADRLTRVALLKRAVLKRCVYGVDLNEMAVELAKVSLWLDAFTLGAPLSFLDHHLKRGNSLIGARIREVEEAVEGTEEKAVQLSLFSGGAFTGLSMATDLMRRVSYLSDNTVAQVEESREAYRGARDHLAQYKRVLDVYTSRWFGNEPGKKLDVAVEFIRNNNTREWLKHLSGPPPETARFDAVTVVQTALNAAHEKRFFHWELEFPEVFFAPRQPGGQDVQLLTDGGFDAVVGNPPWGAKENLLTAEDYKYLQQLGVDNLNYFPYFIVYGVQLVSVGNRFGMVLPDSLLVKEYPRTREYLLANYSLSEIVHLSEAFEDVDHDVVVLLVASEKAASNHVVNGRIVPKGIVNLANVRPSKIPQSAWDDERFDFRFNLLLDTKIELLAQRLYSKSVEYQSICETHEGIHTRHKRAEIFPEKVEVFTERHKPLLLGQRSGDVIEPYFIGWNGRYVNYDLSLCTPNKKGMKPDLVNEEWFTQSKLVIVRTGEQFTTAIDHKQFYLSNNLFSSFFLDRGTTTRMSYEFLCCLLNSSLLQRFLRVRIAPRFGNLYVETKIKHLDILPIIKIDFETPAETRRKLVDELINLYRNNDYQQLLLAVEKYSISNNTGVLHDLLTLLAQEMTRLKANMYEEKARFLRWLESKLLVRPLKDGSTGIDSLNGKTLIQNYLGHYQKGEPELPWQEFHYRLHQNRRRFKTKLAHVLGEIQAEYEKSLATLGPLKRQLAETDALIDQIVYKLYGLTDEEIELIERPRYEQALGEAKEAVLGDKKIKAGSDEAVDEIAEKVLPAARRLLGRVDVRPERAQLDADLPGWHLLPGDVPTFLETAEYNIRHLPDHLDFSTSVIAYAKAVETVLFDRLFVRFRDEARVTAGACRNKFLSQFVAGEREHLTLGSISIILQSSKETALRDFARRVFYKADERFFGDGGVAAQLADEEAVQMRNKAAHDEVLSREAAQEARKWAFAILKNL